MNLARMATLAGTLDGFSDQELDVFHRALSRVMANVVQAKDGGAWICRMCDLAACERPQGSLPGGRSQPRRNTDYREQTLTTTQRDPVGKSLPCERGNLLIRRARPLPTVGRAGCVHRLPATPAAMGGGCPAQERGPGKAAGLAPGHVLDGA